MEIGIVQERYRRIGFSFPLQPFGTSGTPLCEILRWSDFVGACWRQETTGAGPLQEFLMELGLERVPELEKDDFEGLAGVVSVVQVPPVVELVSHVMAQIEASLAISKGETDQVLTVLNRLALRHPEIQRPLVSGVRRILVGNHRDLKQPGICRCLEILQKWGTATDRPYVVRVMREGAVETRLAALGAAVDMDMLDDADLKRVIEALPDERIEDGQYLSWSDLFDSLRGGSPESWRPFLGHEAWTVRQVAARCLQSQANTHPDVECVFDVARDRLLLEDDRDVLVCLGWVLGSCLRRLGVDAAEVLLDGVVKLPEGLDGGRGSAALRSLVRLPADPSTWARLDRILAPLVPTDADIRRNVSIVRSHFNSVDDSPESVAGRLQQKGGWLPDLGDPYLEPTGILAEFMEQRADLQCGLWIATGTETQVPGWIRSWEAARLSITNPQLSQVFATAIIPNSFGDRRAFAAVGCAVSPVPVPVHPVYLACALGMPAGNSALVDDHETAAVLIAMMDDNGLVDAARARLLAAGPVVRSLWNQKLMIDQMNNLSRDKRRDARHHLFLSAAPLPDPIVCARPGLLPATGLGAGLLKLKCLGALPGSDPVGRALVLASLSSVEHLRMASVRWNSTVEGACAAWTYLLDRNDWEGRESACLLARSVPPEFWEGPEGQVRMQMLKDFRTDSDLDVVREARKTCEVWGIEPLDDEPPAGGSRSRRRRGT